MTLVLPRLSLALMAPAAVAALVASSPAWSLGLGEVRAQAILGQPLNLAVPVTLGEGETLGAECASAEVTAGDVKLQPGMVRVRITQGRDASESIIRVSTTVPVDEPVLLVQVGAGCPIRITRALTVLADPPMVAPTFAAAVPAPAAPEAPRSATPEGTASTVTAAPAAAEGPPRARRPATPTRASRAAVARPASREATPEASTAGTPATARRSMPVVRSETARPRLKLESAQVSPAAVAASAADAQATALRASTAAAEAAASAAESAASAARQRMQDMENELAKVRADAKAQTDALLQLRQQIAQDRAQRDRQSSVSPYLWGIVGLLALLALWLGWQLRRMQALQRRSQWWERSRMAEQSASARFDEESRFAASEPTPAPRPKPAPRPDVGAASVPGRLAQPIVTEHGAFDSMLAPPTVPAPVAVTIPPLKQPEEETSRPMSVDEQIDLEQQADFFIALGHDDAAIDLLMAHLRSTGGSTPLPFLKLLEIHRQRGDREAYERTRMRFNQRFNSVAPEWASDAKGGRVLEDYPLTIARLQRAWPKPLDAMAELESLLFRRGADAELFELPAYQEVLFLYQLARDLHQAEQISRPDVAVGAVDVLLPIGASSGASLTERSLQPRDAKSGDELDLDLSRPMPLAPGEEPPLEKIRIELDGDPPKPKTSDGWGDEPR